MSFILRSTPAQKAYQLFHYQFLSEKEPGSTLADLDLDLDIHKSINKLRRHHWTHADMAHYGFLSSIIFFVFVIFPASFLIKIPILAAFITCFLVPLTSSFFLHALPIFTWLALFFSASKIPYSWKPAISVKFLPAMETIMYGDNLSNVLAESNNSFLDVLAWLPYGIIHFASPFVVALFIFLFAPPTSLRSFGFAFGYMNLTGVLIQLLFPSAAPWYKNIHGLQPANYSMNGSPGGLGRIDQLFGIDMFTSTFENSPLVFGAFPSLHSGCAVMDVLFLCWLFPRYTPIWWFYASLLWWSTMYLTHHYFIDLIFGACLSLTVFTYVKYTKLPIVNPKKYCRWSYKEIALIDVHGSDPLTTFIPLHDDIEEGHELESFSHPSLEQRSRQNSHNLSIYPESTSRSLSQSSFLYDDNNDISEGETDISNPESMFDGRRTHEEIQASVNTSKTSLNDVDSHSHPGFKTSPAPVPSVAQR